MSKINIAITKKMVLYVVLVSFFIVYLFISNNLVAGFMSEHQLKKDSLDNYEESSPVIFSLDNISYDNLTGNVTVISWAFCPTDKNNENREATILFVSDNNIYSVDMQADINRMDARSVLINQYTVPSKLIGVVQDFNVINLPDDVYQIYIYVKENDEVFGIVPTGIYYEKDGRLFDKVPYPAEKVSIEHDIEYLEEASSSVETSVEDGTLTIDGWAFIDDIDAQSQTITAVLTSESGEETAYSTQQVSRGDVAEHFDNALYTYSGFITSVPVKDLSKGKYKVTLLVENDDNIMKTLEYGFEIN